MFGAVCFIVQHIAAQPPQLGCGIKADVGGVPNTYGIDRVQNTGKVLVEQIALFAEPPADRGSELKKFPQRAVKVRGFSLADNALVLIKYVQLYHAFQSFALCGIETRKNVIVKSIFGIPDKKTALFFKPLLKAKKRR